MTLCRMVRGVIMVAVLGASCANGGCSDRCTAGPLPASDAGVRLDDDGTFLASPDPTKIVVTSGGGRVVVNQVVLHAQRGTRRGHIDKLAASVGGRVIGQSPALCTYQVEVPSASLGELEAIIRKLETRPRVRSAVPNFEGTPKTVRGPGQGAAAGAAAVPP